MWRRLNQRLKKGGKIIYCITCRNALTEIKFNGFKTLVCTFCGAVVVDTGGSYKYGGTFNGSVPARRFISENKNKEETN
jgi:hypothetical protein